MRFVWRCSGVSVFVQKRATGLTNTNLFDRLACINLMKATTKKVQFWLTTTRVIMTFIHPYILIASSPAIPRMVALGEMAHHVTKPRDDHYLLTWTSIVLRPSAISSLVKERTLLVTCNINSRTKGPARGKRRALICNGFGIYETLKLLKFCFVNSIVFCRLYTSI